MQILDVPIVLNSVDKPIPSQMFWDGCQLYLAGLQQAPEGLISNLPGLQFRFTTISGTEVSPAIDTSYLEQQDPLSKAFGIVAIVAGGDHHLVPVSEQSSRFFPSYNTPIITQRLNSWLSRFITIPTGLLTVTSGVKDVVQRSRISNNRDAMHEFLKSVRIQIIKTNRKAYYPDQQQSITINKLTLNGAQTLQLPGGGKLTLPHTASGGELEVSPLITLIPWGLAADKNRDIYQGLYMFSPYPAVLATAAVGLELGLPVKTS